MTFTLSRRVKGDLRIPWIVLLPAALLLVLVVHVMLGKVAYIEQAITASLYLIWAAMLMVLGSLLRRRVGVDVLVKTLAWCVLAGGVLNAFAGILQTYDIRGLLAPVILYKVGDRAYGNIAQANHYANYVTLAIGSLAFLAVRGMMPRVLAYILFAILIYSLALSASISVWLYLTLLVSLAYGVYLRQRSPEHQRLLLLCVVVAVGFGLAQLLIRLPGLEPTPRFVSATERLFYQPTSIWIRFKLWYDAWLMFLDSPLLGVGYGQFAWQQFLMAGSQLGDPITGFIHHTHNLIMQLLAETGIAGTGILIVAVALWIWGQRMTMFDTAQWWLLAVMGILAIHSLLEYPLWSAYFLGIAAVLLGAGETRFISLRNTNYLRAGVLIVVATGAFNAVTMIKRYHIFETSLYTPLNATLEQFRANNRALLGLRDSLFVPYVDIASAMTIGLNSNNLKAKLEFVRKVARFAPTGPVVYNYSALLALHGDTREAIDILDRAVIVYPDYLQHFVPHLYQSMDKLQFAPYLERLQKHDDLRKKAAKGKGMNP